MVPTLRKSYMRAKNVPASSFHQSELLFYILLALVICHPSLSLLFVSEAEKVTSEMARNMTPSCDVGCRAAQKLANKSCTADMSDTLDFIHPHAQLLLRMNTMYVWWPFHDQ